MDTAGRRIGGLWGLDDGLPEQLTKLRILLQWLING